MKTKEYVQKFINEYEKGFDQAVVNIYNGLIGEFETLIKARNVKSPQGLIGILNDLDKKWKNFSIKVNTQLKAEGDVKLRPEGFRKAICDKSEEVNRIWN